MNRKEKLYAFLKEQAKVPLLAEEIAIMLGAQDEIEEVLKLLEELVSEGMVIKGKKGRYEAAEKRGIYVGIYRHNARGFGFVSGEGEDFFIPEEGRGGAYNGDTVAVREKKSRKHSREGEIVQIIKRKNETVTAIYRKGFARACDISLDLKIKITNPSDSFENCRVIVKIDDFKRKDGSVLLNLGSVKEAESEIRAIMYEHKIPEKFPDDVLNSAAEIVMETDLPERVDLRDIKTVTIDGADARDLDDAISLTKDEDGNYRLYVHIADVSHFVKEGDVIDKEALQRGCSYYFPDRVVPMLPQKLSNGLCSLNPGEDKATLTTAMVINESGSVVSYEICESVIKSDHRMEYGVVTQLMENENDPLWEKYEDVRQMLYDMEKLMNILRKRRFEKGSIDFNIPEPKIIIDENGKVADVVLEKNTVSNRIIEEFMLCCNRVLAEHAFWAQMPFVYRVHEEPGAEKIEKFRKFIALFGLKIGGKATGGRMMTLLREIEGEMYERAVNTVLLRSMAKARYDAENIGHFGLGATYYCHFTSPIRRYPDLLCHRIIKESLKGKPLQKFIPITLDAAEKSSERERAAEEAERDVSRLKICEYMKNYIGEEFLATVSSITNFGFFAELDNGIEGLVRVEDIKGDYYIFEEETLSLRGERSGRRYKIGDRVKILVAGVDTAARYIDFFIAEGGQPWKITK